MCGIYGRYNYKTQRPVVADDIKERTNLLLHRGPDDEGFFISNYLGFGFRRLSIIDLESGHQPMSDQKKSVWIIYNGEIYNFPELKTKLESYGHIFRTKCDTEVIIHGYKQWGTEVFNHLNGMFGLAIWDDERQKLILARDAMGIKPLYYKIDAEGIHFGSEIRSLLSTERKPEVDETALNLFLKYRYTPSPLTLFENIKKLTPGKMLIIEDDNEKLVRWYNYKPEPLSDKITTNEILEELSCIYKRAVKRHLLSDVPVGLLLSGGVDSGLLMALMNLYNNGWPTFTVGYGKTFKDDELIDAAKTAEIFSSKHSSVSISQGIFENELTKIIAQLEEPVASSSIVPMYFVSKIAKKDVKVALIGQGPDELFGGYRRHIGVRYGEYWRKLPKEFHSMFRNLILKTNRNETFKRAVNSLHEDDRMKRYQSVFSLIRSDLVDDLFQDGIINKDISANVLDSWAELEPLMESLDELGGLQFLEIRSSLPDELLMYADKLSMAHSLEVRVPYLDREVVEYVERIGQKLKVRNGRGKWIHKKLCQQYLPKEIIQRKKKGFAVNVVDEWFQESLSNKMEGYFKDPKSKMYNYLKYYEVNKLLNEHITGKEDNHKLLFSLIVFEEWLRINIS